MAKTSSVILTLDYYKMISIFKPYFSLYCNFFIYFQFLKVLNQGTFCKPIIQNQPKFDQKNVQRRYFSH